MCNYSKLVEDHLCHRALSTWRQPNVRGDMGERNLSPGFSGPHDVDAVCAGQTRVSGLRRRVFSTGASTGCAHVPGRVPHGPAGYPQAPVDDRLPRGGPGPVASAFATRRDPDPPVRLGGRTNAGSGCPIILSVGAATLGTTERRKRPGPCEHRPVRQRVPRRRALPARRVGRPRRRPGARPGRRRGRWARPRPDAARRTTTPSSPCSARCCSPRTRSPTSSSRSAASTSTGPAHETDLRRDRRPLRPRRAGRPDHRDGRARSGAASWPGSAARRTSTPCRRACRSPPTPATTPRSSARRRSCAGWSTPAPGSPRWGTPGRARSTRSSTGPRPRSTASPTSARRRTTRR